jgi:glycosyl transferase family 25
MTFLAITKNKLIFRRVGLIAIAQIHICAIGISDVEINFSHYMPLKNILKKIMIIPLILVLGIFVYPTGYFVLEDNTDLQIDVAEGPYHGTGAYIINLDRSRERYEYIKPNITKLDLDAVRISAVDGNLLSDAEIKANVDINSYKKYLGHLPKKGTIGCSLSHIKVWQTFLNSNLEYAVVFEDDISFNPTQLKAAITELPEHKNHWDIVAFEIYHGGTPLAIEELQDNKKLAVYLTEISHTGAYMLNRHAAAELLKKALPIKMPIDHFYTRSWEFDLTFTGIENPRLVHQTLGDSDIARSKNLFHSDISFIDLAQKITYKAQSYIIRLLYNLQRYLDSEKSYQISD